MSLSERGKHLAFLSVLRLLIVSIKFPRQINAHSVFFLAFLTGHQSSNSLKYWDNDKPRFMTGLFYCTKMLLKLISLHKTSKMDLKFMNISYKSTLVIFNVDRDASWSMMEMLPGSDTGVEIRGNFLTRHKFTNLIKSVSL